ncbi:unnamed protein product [Cyclocybe aegerita]|uniref:Phosphatidylinositol-specific phospholipase C X domain-containing protein n=1 Tax=Cyclocybe aegerita TaxID=1973307 RepID=A0A8S0WVT4_CYCAE|nr:unnamed protein product [Cyclocybe aegerita]
MSPQVLLPYNFHYAPHHFSTTLVKGFRREIILRRTYQPDVAEPAATPGIEELLLEKDWHIHPEGFKIRFSMTLSASWQVVPVPVGCPWRVFTSRISRGHHKLVILSRRNLASFLSELPNRLPLSSLSLPGTHDTMAFYGWPVSQCQTVPLSTQLNGGIRVLDIRLAVIPPPSPKEAPLTKDQQLIAYHGLWPQQTPFLAILNDVHTFLTSPIGCMETIIMSIKQEDFAVTPTPLFSQLVRETIVQGPGGWDDSQLSDSGVNRGMWFLENRIPTLGEVRGKVVMLSRFGGNGAGWEGGLEGLGIHPTTWPDSDQEGFEWELKGTRVRTHDWYNIPSFFKIPDKVERASANLIPPADSPGPVLPVTFFSAASFPFALPPTVAKGFGWPKWGLGIEGVNSRLGKWLLDQLGGETQSGTAMTDVEKGKVAALSEQKEPRIRGWTFLDYYSEPEGGEIIPLLVECNFRGRKEGEEGW